MKMLDLGGDMFERERECDECRAVGIGVGGARGESSSRKERVV
jgi:hypothetical protein